LSSAELLDYYRRRAAEYEAIYAKPERQADLARLRETIPARLRGKRVLEIACGTGYWTERVARVAASVVSTDALDEPMQVARTKSYPPGVVRFEQGDAYRLDAKLGSFDGALAVFWWSHIPLARIGEFLDSLHARLAPGAVVVMMDNTYVDGSSTPIAETDAQGNTYQLRKLKDGSVSRVLKNFPTEAGLRAALGKRAASFSWEALQYYWLAEYRVA
jgi:demethylmenaquinone methyltransferase/2-methoxy-6-polyprenyl-1,4-benzoquinol methylase